MDQTVKFTPLDMQTWPRWQMFYYFSKMAPTGYSLTVDLDVTAMRTALKHAGIKFFPAYLWLVTRTLQMQKEFKIAELDGQVGCFDTLTPLYAAFHEDDKTFSFMWTEYTDDFMAFYQSYLDNQRRYGGSHGVLAQAGQTPPANAYTISCVPWVSFKHFSVHSYENKPYYLPSIEAGRFYEKDGRIMMPLSITCHHAATDGYHINRFLETLQSEAEAFAEDVPHFRLL